MEAFLRRNPVLKTKKKKSIDLQYINGAIIQIIKAWFQKLYIPAIQAIKPENR
jgi:hypothetical protein